MIRRRAGVYLRVLIVIQSRKSESGLPHHEDIGSTTDGQVMLVQKLRGHLPAAQPC